MTEAWDGNGGPGMYPVDPQVETHQLHSVPQNEEGRDATAEQPIHVRIAQALEEKGLDAQTIAVVSGKFDYDHTEESPNNTVLGERLGLDRNTVGSILRTGILALEGSDVLLDEKDQYPKILFDHIRTGGKRRAPGRVTALQEIQRYGRMLPKPQKQIVGGTVVRRVVADESDTTFANSRRGTKRGRAAAQGAVRNEESLLEEANDNDATVPDMSDLFTENAAEFNSSAHVSVDTVRMYLNGVGRYQLLNAEQEVHLSKTIEAGVFAQERLDIAKKSGALISMDAQLRRDLREIVRDGEKAKNTMINANLRLGVYYAKKYTGRGMDFPDLIQEANLGLIRAVEMFDYQKGYKFSTYASWWIKQTITRSLADKGRMIRIPVHTVEMLSRMYGIEREAEIKGSPITDEEMSAELGVSIERVGELKEWRRVPISIDQRIGDDDSAELGDFILDGDAPDAEEAVVRDDAVSVLEAVVDTLSEREAQIIRMRYGLGGKRPMHLKEIGQVFNLTHERIRQIESKAMTKLRHPSRSRALRDYI